MANTKIISLFERTIVFQGCSCSLDAYNPARADRGEEYMDESRVHARYARTLDRLQVIWEFRRSLVDIICETRSIQATLNRFK